MSEQTETVQTQEQTNEQSQANLLQVEETTADQNAAAETAQTGAADQRPDWLPEKFKTPEDLAKSYVELEKSLSDKAPKVPEQYDFAYTKDFGLADMDDELQKEVTQVFQHAKLTDQQAKEVMALYADQVGKLTEQLATAPRVDLKTEQSALQKTWGDAYEQNIQAVKQFADTLPKRVLEQPLVDTAEGIQFLQQLMQSNRGDNPITTPQATQPSFVAIREQINDMRADTKMRLPAGDPVGEAHRQKLYNLYEQLERAKQ